MRHAVAVLVASASFLGCGGGEDAAAPSSPPSSAESSSEPTATSGTPRSRAARPSDALLTGHTGLAGFALSGDGSTLFVATERYDGAATQLGSYVLDLRSPTSRPTRLHSGNDGPYLSWHGASDDGRFVLESWSDGLHRVSRDGASDVLVPDSARYWFSPAISADGAGVAFVRDDVLRIVDVASGETTRVPLAADTSASPVAMLDAATALVSVGRPDGLRALRRVRTGSDSADVCAPCSGGYAGREARLEHGDDGAWRAVSPDGERPLGEGSHWAVSASGRVWAHTAMVEARAYEYEQHLRVDGALAHPIDRVLDGSITDLGTVLVGEDGTTVAEVAVRAGETRESCVTVLLPEVRVIACEPCDSTTEHCR